MAEKYDLKPDLSNPNTAHAREVTLVGGNKRVLEYGCGFGYTSQAMAARGCKVTGVEIDADAAKRAADHCERVIVGDLESLDLDAELGDARFDAILFGDVLEHLRDPLGILRQAKELLAPGGCVVACIPNVAHGSIRLALLQGRFEYQQLGILDETHLRFFTRDSIERLFADAGLAIMEVQTIVASPFGTNIPLKADDFSPDVLALLANDPTAEAFQYLVKAVVDDAAGLVASAAYREAGFHRQIERLERLCARETARADEVTRWAEHLVRALSQAERRLSRIERLRLVQLYRRVTRRPPS